MKQDQKRYKQLPGFPGYTGAVTTGGPQGPRELKPLTDAERAELSRAGIPHDPAQPLPYTPPPPVLNRPMRLEIIGPLGLAAIVLFLFTWLLSVPASGERGYYAKLLKGEVTSLAPAAGTH